VKFSFVWTVCTVVAFVAFVNDGPWLAVALGAYTLAWLSYRSAIRAGSSFGYLLRLVVDLHRFDFLTAAHRRLPINLDDERRSFPLVFEALTSDPSSTAAQIPYSHPEQHESAS
jgi:hypothetical protein